MVSLRERFKAKLGRGTPRTLASTEKTQVEPPTALSSHNEATTKAKVDTPERLDSIPERLWNRAYEQVKESDAGIVDAYEKILSNRLYHGVADSSESLQSTKLESQHNEIAIESEKRRAQMRHLIQQGLRRTEKDARAKQGMEENIRTVMVVKESVDKAMHASPEAAIPWLGVCIALEILLNPLTESNSNRQGIAYVVSRMDWYWNMSSLLLSDNLINPDAEGLRVELEKGVIHLYTALILYQAKSVCYYHRGRFSVWLRDSVKLDDWGGELSSIQAAEAVVQTDSAQYNTTAIRTRLSELAFIAKTQNLKLDSIRSAVQEQTLKQENWHDEAANNKCLVDLRVTDPRDDKKRIEDTKGGLLRDSFLWILENHTFREWRDDPQKRLIRIKADPGMGKTMLLCGIIDELQKSLGPTDVLSYFFCQETDPRINSATAVLRGLVYMLVHQQPSLTKHVRKRYDQAGETIFDDVNSFVVLCDIFKDIIQDSSLGSCHLAIDALDECVGDLQKLLQLITESAELGHRVKWIVTSRNLPHIEEWLQGPGDNAKLDLELSPETVSTGVSFFIRERVKNLAQQKKYDQRTHDSVLSYLETHAHSTFLWVALVCQDLQDVPRRNALSRVKSFPSGLKSLYKRMLKRMSSSEDAGSCKQILAVATTVYRPVTIHELIGLVEALDEYTDDLDSVRDLVSLCGSFLTLREDTLYFVHQSAKDFLLDEALHHIFPEGIRVAHRTIYSESLVILSRDLHRDMYGLKAPGHLAEDVRKPFPDPLRASSYSCVFWFYHLTGSIAGISPKDSPDLQDGGSLDLFLRNKYLNWLEALSLTHYVLVAVETLGSLRTLLHAQSNATRLNGFVEDARRFLMSNQFGIEKSPLQIYVAALLFSPKNSLTRRTFSHEEPDWITIKPDVDDDWGACLYTLEGHRLAVLSVAFSHDSNRLATASDDKTVRIWDARSGACLYVLEGHSGLVRSVTFSHDSTLLASGSYDNTIRIWNREGDYVRTLVSHSEPIRGIAFSRDSTQLVSNSLDETIKIWDVDSGTCIRTLEGVHELRDMVVAYSVAYSRTSDELASLASGNSIKIWDPNTGICQRTLTCPQPMGYFSFSHDLGLVALAHDSAIEVWDSINNVLVKTLKGHQKPVLRVAFSTDSSKLATTSTDRIMKIWDVESGVCSRTLMTETQFTASLAWSHDSTRLLSGSADGTARLWELGNTIGSSKAAEPDVRIFHVAFSRVLNVLATGSDLGAVHLWDATSGARLRTLSGHVEPVVSVTFGHSSSLLASGSNDKTVKLWDPGRDACLRTLEGHSGRVRSIIFSEDSSLLASISNDSTIRVWDVDSGTCLQILSCPKDTDLDFSSASFSPDSSQLVSGLFDGSIQVWNVGNGLCVRTFEAHQSHVWSAIFSSNMMQLASTSAGGELRIWDATDGTCLKTYPRTVRSELLSFESTEGVVQTDFGTMSLRESAHLQATGAADYSRPRYQGLGIGYDADWITYNGERFVWLPAEYRSRRCAVFGNKVVTTGAVGKLQIYDFDIQKLRGS